MILRLLLVLVLLLASPCAHAQAIGFMGAETPGTKIDAFVKISTVIASASASIQFTGLNSTYNTYFIDCTGLLASTVGIFTLFVGEGGGPTWETSANYKNEMLLTGDGNPGPGATGVNTATATNIIGFSFGNSTTVPESIQLSIDNVSSSSLVKNISFSTVQYLDSGAGAYFLNGGSYWTSDTNAITGIEIVPTAGNIAAGSCTLYGVLK